MLIDRLTFKDFLVFPGEQTIDFTYREGRNLTLILAPNNTGKTTVIRALDFLLFGEHDKKRRENLPCHATVAELAPGATETASVSAVVRQGDQRFTVTREISFSRRSNESLATREVDLRLEVLQHNEDTADYYMAETQGTEDFIANLVPRAMFDFFFFKGEELTETLLRPQKNTAIPDQLKKLLYQREWERASETLAKAEREFERKLGAISGERERYEALLQQRAGLRSKINANTEQRQAKCKELEDLESQRTIADKKIFELASKANPGRKKELELARNELKKIERDRAQIQEKRRGQLGKNSAVMLLQTHLPRVREHLSDLKRNRALPPDISEGIIAKILEDHTCICRRECVAGTPAYEAIEELRQESLAEDVADELWKLHTLTDPKSVRSFQVQIRDAAQQLRVNSGRNQELAAREAQLNDQREALEASVDLDAESQLKEQQLLRAKCEQDARSLDGIIDRLARQILADENQLKEVEAAIRKADPATKQAEHLLVARDICQTFSDLVKRCSDRMVRSIHRELQRDVANMYTAIVTDGSTAIVDESTLLPSIERGGVVGLFAGGGQDQVLLLCYLISLAHLRATVNAALRERFGLAQFHEQGFFMDSVFGQTQAAYKRAVAELLPQHMKQLVLLLADQQWDKAVQVGIEKHCTDVYGFELFSPSDVKESDYEFDLDGKAVRLLSRIDSEQQARTVIRRLK